MKKSIFTLVLFSSLFLLGCQNEQDSRSIESSTTTATDGSIVEIVSEDQKIYIDENTFMDGTDMYKTTQNKDDRKNRESEIIADGKNYYLMFIFPNPDDGSKEDLWYEEYEE